MNAVRATPSGDRSAALDGVRSWERAMSATGRAAEMSGIGVAPRTSWDDHAPISTPRLLLPLSYTTRRELLLPYYAVCRPIRCFVACAQTVTDVAEGRRAGHD